MNIPYIPLLPYSKSFNHEGIAPLPKSYVIEAVQPFGRTPVIATLGGKKWATLLWTEKSGDTMIAVPKKVRGKLDEGDEVEISFVYDYERF